MFYYLKSAASAVVYSSKQFISAVSSQKKAIAPAFQTLTSKSSYQEIKRLTMLHFYSDLLPLIAIQTMVNLVAFYQEPTNTEAEEDSFWLNPILMGGVIAVAYLFKTRTQVQASVHKPFLNLQTIRYLYAAGPTENSVCKINSCTVERYFKGFCRELINYAVIELALQGVASLPYLHSAAFLLRVYNQGRFLLTLNILHLCERHQQIFLEEYPEWALALGIMQELMRLSFAESFKLLVSVTHAASNLVLTSEILALTNNTAPYYNIMGEQLAFLVTCCVMAHMIMPQEVEQVSRQFRDPVNALERISGAGFDRALALGQQTIPPTVKALVKVLMRQPPSSIPWAKIYNSMKNSWNHPIVSPLKWMVIPPLLRDLSILAKDPFIGPFWDEFTPKIRSIIYDIEDFKKNKGIQAAIKYPKVGSVIGKMIAYKYDIRISQAAIKALLVIAGHPLFIIFLNDLAMHLAKSAKSHTITFQDSTPLRSHTASESPSSEQTPKIALSLTPSHKQVITPATASSPKVPIFLNPQGKVPMVGRRGKVPMEPSQAKVGGRSVAIG